MTFEMLGFLMLNKDFFVVKFSVAIPEKYRENVVANVKKISDDFLTNTMVYFASSSYVPLCFEKSILESKLRISCSFLSEI